MKKTIKKRRISMYNPFFFDQDTFYPAFISDLENCRQEVIIESPFITSKRMQTLWPIFNSLINRNIKIYVITRDPKEHSSKYEYQSETEIQAMENSGIQVLICSGNHHRKIAIIDRTIVWQGSLNILSQIQSKEFMQRTNNRYFAKNLFDFLNYKKYI